MRLKQIDLTNGMLDPDLLYYYFIDENDPMGDIISMRKPQGGKHEDIINKKPKIFKIDTKKKGKNKK